MGCCSSAEAGASHDSSSTEVAVAARPHSSRAFTSHSDARAVSASIVAANPAVIAPDARPNKPLRAVAPVAKCPPEMTFAPWTHSELLRQRAAFFDTRVTGHQEVWCALRLVCDMLRQGDVAGAQGVFDAAGLTCPTGLVTLDKKTSKRGGVFDERGIAYEIPGWCVMDPADVREDEQVEEEEEEEGASLDGDIEKEGVLSEKGHEEPGALVNVRARLSNGGSDVLVEVGMRQKVSALRQAIQEQAGLSNQVKLVYMGKILPENKRLEDTDWKQGHVINALVFQ